MVTTTIKSDGDLARDLRSRLCEHYDVIVESRHTPDGKDLLIELHLYPKGTLPIEKPIKRKHNRIMN